ncbi:MAG: hypothetical protein Q4F52_09945 [Bacteroidaceae bacterium]|nr:hypothetical protein [Bacteroidaceae bacterium]
MLKRVQHDQREELHDQQGKQHDKKVIYTLRHPELVSGSVRGEWSDEARGEMLKRVQHDVKGNGMTRRGPHDVTR